MATYPRKCLWCLKSEDEVTFLKKAHTIPKSLGGQNYNSNVCDECNSFFGNKQKGEKYSIEEALKEAFGITRFRFLQNSKPKRKVGKYKSRFFDIKERNGKSRLIVKPSFRFDISFQIKLCYFFQRGLYKMILEELNRQKGLGFEDKYNVIRYFARYGLGVPTVIYFNRLHGIMITLEYEFESPFLMFDRMLYLYSNEKFMEIEFLGHVFGIPLTKFTKDEFEDYIKKSMDLKKGIFKDAIIIRKLTDIDFTLNIMNS